jgi:arylsulfatase A-like enzyme
VPRILLPVAILALGLAAAPAAQSGAPPNILLIVSDDHAWSDYGFMGHPHVRTPAIDRLAASGTTFTRGYVPTPLCRPSLATLLTGLYPHQHGITGNDPPGFGKTMWDPAARATLVDVFRRNRHVLPAMLAEKGYVNLQTGKWWEGRPQDFGFSAAMTHGEVTRKGRHGDDGLTIGREGMKPVFDFIDGAGGKPFFVWYAPFLPHTPHNPPDRLLQHYASPGLPPAVASYYAMIAWLDETVGALLDGLDRRGLSDNTLVLYVSDNGWTQSPDPKPSQPTRGKMSPYDAGIRTPIIVRWPGRSKPGRDDRTLAGSIDIMPTILRAAGITPPSGLPGIDLLDASALARRHTLFGSLFVHTAVAVNDPIANLKYRYAIREDGWKLILPYTPNRDATLMIDGRTADWMRFEPELYNVRDDPREEHDRAAERPEIVKELRAAIDGWWKVP